MYQYLFSSQMLVFSCDDILDDESEELFAVDNLFYTIHAKPEL